jgi:hypothetical protein
VSSHVGSASRSSSQEKKKGGWAKKKKKQNTRNNNNSNTSLTTTKKANKYQKVLQRLTFALVDEIREIVLNELQSQLLDW